MKEEQVNIEQEIRSSRDSAKSEILKACEDESINLHMLSETLKIKSSLLVRNRSHSTYYVKVSKACGEGQDGFFEITPGSSETWKRCIYHDVTIVLSDGVKEIVRTKYTMGNGGYFDIEDGGYLTWVIPVPPPQ